MGWRNILGEFKGESPLRKKKGTVPKSIYHAGVEPFKYTKGTVTVKIQIDVRLKITT